MALRTIEEFETDLPSRPRLFSALRISQSWRHSSSSNTMWASCLPQRVSYHPMLDSRSDAADRRHEARCGEHEHADRRHGEHDARNGEAAPG